MYMDLKHCPDKVFTYKIGFISPATTLMSQSIIIRKNVINNML